VTQSPPPADTSSILANRAGVDRGFIDDLVRLGVLTVDATVTGQEGVVRRVRVLHGLAASGLPLEVLAAAIRDGTLSLDFVDQPAYDRFTAFEDVTFEDVARRTAIPVELLLVVREAMGAPPARPGDRMRPAEMDVVPYIEVLTRQGIGAEAVEHTLRVAGDGMRRLSETESAWWWSEVLGPLVRSGLPAEEIGRRTEEFARRSEPVTDALVVALHHGQQAHSWLRNIFEVFEELLDGAGLYTRLTRQPAIAFVDVTGYSRLTEERGDASAAALAAGMARIVQREATGRGGRTIKWLGDGVMQLYPEAAEATLASLDAMDRLQAEGLPPAHAGIHTGPVLFQEGDYFGRTVNAASRIADQARPGQVLVSQAVVEASAGAPVTFERIGPVELKNLAAPMVLHIARRARSD